MGKTGSKWCNQRPGNRLLAAAVIALVVITVAETVKCYLKNHPKTVCEPRPGDHSVAGEKAVPPRGNAFDRLSTKIANTKQTAHQTAPENTPPTPNHN